MRVVQFGLGPIGQACARLASTRPDLELVGGLDLDPSRVGKDLGTVIGIDELGVPVRDDAEAALEAWKPDVVLHTTSSFLDQIEEQLLLCASSGASVVSSSEELFWPFERDPGFCERVDAAAQEAGVAVIGTGVNPGFVMDLLPALLSGVMARVDRVVVERVVDAGKRREPLQRKVGAGLTVDQFREREAAGGFGHIGLPESALLAAAAMGWPVDELEEEFGPHVATTTHQTDVVDVAEGDVAGIHQVVRVISGGEERVTLTLTMAVGEDGYDRVVLHGDPGMDVLVQNGGTFGDTATVAAVVNTAERISGLKPGLRTMLDVPAAVGYRGWRVAA